MNETQAQDQVVYIVIATSKTTNATHIAGVYSSHEKALQRIEGKSRAIYSYTIFGEQVQ